MAQFQVGQRVVLVNINDGMGGQYPRNQSNTVGNTGTVTSSYAHGANVRWDNNSHNSYNNSNLMPEGFEEPVPKKTRQLSAKKLQEIEQRIDTLLGDMDVYPEKEEQIQEELEQLEQQL